MWLGGLRWLNLHGVEDESVVLVVVHDCSVDGGDAGSGGGGGGWGSVCVVVVKQWWCEWCWQW